MNNDEFDNFLFDGIPLEYAKETYYVFIVSAIHELIVSGKCRQSAFEFVFNTRRCIQNQILTDIRPSQGLQHFQSYERTLCGELVCSILIKAACIIHKFQSNYVSFSIDIYKKFTLSLDIKGELNYKIVSALLTESACRYISINNIYEIQQDIILEDYRSIKNRNQSIDI